MTNVRIEFINESTVLDDDEVRSVICALQAQVRRDFAPIWGTNADLTLVPKKSKRNPSAWWIAILNDSEQAGVLGYHDLTNQGLPLGKIFARTAKKSGIQWTVTASHELLETLANPDGNLFARSHPDEGILYPYEVCDPCEPDKFGYKIDGVLVTDFVHPTWFESFHKKGTQFDQSHHMRRPFHILPGGDVTKFDMRLHEIKPRRSTKTRFDNRKEKHKTPRSEWRPSSVAPI
jgi:hypothetical protein